MPEQVSLPELPLLPTTVIGSTPVPAWMERLKTDYHQHRLSRAQLEELHETAIKATLVDQTCAGLDIVSDGELRRDNDIDYLLARLPGIAIPEQPKHCYCEYYQASLPVPLPSPAGEPPLDLAADFAFTAAHTSAPIKVSFPGPFSLVRHIRNDAYPDDRTLLLAIAAVLNREAHALAERGAKLLQIDEPFLAGHPDQVTTAVEAINHVVDDVAVTWAWHVCYGNRYSRPHGEGHYDFLFPAALDAAIDQLVLEFAREGFEELPVLEASDWNRTVGLGVIDVTHTTVESPQLVADRIRTALTVVPTEQLVINPDCGLRGLPTTVARAKLAAMVTGTALVRDELAANTPPLALASAQGQPQATATPPTADPVSNRQGA